MEGRLYNKYMKDIIMLSLNSKSQSLGLNCNNGQESQSFLNSHEINARDVWSKNLKHEGGKEREKKKQGHRLHCNYIYGTRDY